MAHQIPTKDLIGFILAAEQDAKLTEDFLRIKSAAELHAFFQGHDFKAIPLADCEAILTARKQAIGLFVDYKNSFGGCPPNAHY